MPPHQKTVSANLCLHVRWNGGCRPILLADGLRSMEKEFNFDGFVWELDVAVLGAV